MGYDNNVKEEVSPPPRAKVTKRGSGSSSISLPPLSSSASGSSSSPTSALPTSEGAPSGDGSSIENPASAASTTLSQKRLWASLWAFAALAIASLAFWFALNQPTTAPMHEPPGGLWTEFWQPREVNRWQRPQKVITQNNLESVAFSPDGKSALAAGQAGTLLQSLDAGQTWQTRASGSTEPLTSVAFSPDGKTALAAGQAGTLLQSLDAGQTWQTRASGSKESLTSVAFSPDGKTALAAGYTGTLLQSLDAGQTWQTRTSGSTEYLNSVAFSPDGKTALAAGWAGTLLQSLDAGQTWQTTASGSKESLRSVAFSPDGKTALAAGQAGTLLQSLDAGQTWQTMASGIKEVLSSVAFSPDGKTALAVGITGSLLKSLDAGQSWQSVASGIRGVLYSVAFSPDGKTALAAGWRGTLFKSADAGQSWQTVASGRMNYLYSVAFSSDGKTALAAGLAGTLLKSSDAGQSWQTVASGSDEILLSIAFSPDGKTALVAGAAGTLLKSLDAGQSWQTLASGIKGVLNSVAFSSDEKTALAAGDAGTLLQSADAGQTWQTRASGSKENITSVAFSPDGKTALAAGWAGTLLQSADAGQTWQTRASGRKEDLASVAFSLDGKTALAAGWAGTLLQSADAGQSWQAVGLYSKSPGPWFTALLAALAIASILISRFLLAPGKTLLERLGILSNAVTDKPIESANEDKLNFNPVVEALSKFLRHPATQPSLSIAINAAWGMGKSSFMNMLASSLKKKGAQPVHFNVWHHQHEEVLLAPLLQAIVSQAIPGWTTRAGWGFRWRLWRQRCGNWNWAFWWGSLAPLSVPLYLGWVAWRPWADDSKAPFGLVDEVVRDAHTLVSMLTSGQWQASVKNGSLWEVAAAALMAITSDLTNALIVLAVVAMVVAWVMLFSYTLRPFPASPAILVASLDKRFSLSKAEAQTDFRQRFRRHFGQVARALQPKTMVIFIDDLDRCEPKKAAELLEAANYLSDAGPCFIILGIAREIVEAQVANAHKVVAEEQAAMQRVRKGEVLTKDAKEAQDDADRLTYAQKYLRKLVQLDVALPRLEATRSIQLLLGKLGVDSAQIAANAEKKPWLSPRLRGFSLLWLLLLGCGGLAIWRTNVTVKLIEDARVEEVSRLLQRTAVLRQEVEGARVYANWLSDVAGNKSPPPAPAASPATLPAGPAIGSPLLYKAKAEMMQTVLRDLEAGLAALEREAREGQPKTFAKLKEKAYQPSFVVYTAYITSPQLDGRSWEDIKKGLQAPAPKAAEPLVKTAPPPPKDNPDRDKIRNPSAATGPTVAAENPLWDTNMGFFVAAMLILLAAIFRAKDNYQEQPTPEYEAAVAKWQAALLQNPDTATPRELKRFMNLSRYAVARLQTATGTASPSTTDGNKLPIAEARIVELTAKWLASAGKVKPVEMRSALAMGGATSDEVALFLEIVGDLSDGSADGSSAKRPKIVGASDDLDESDKAEDV